MTGHFAPHDLDAEAMDLFCAYLAQLQKQGTWVESDMAQLVSCVRARQRARVLFKAADAEPFIKGSRSTRGQQALRRGAEGGKTMP